MMRALATLTLGSALLAPSVSDAQCTTTDLMTCLTEGGVLATRDGACWCDVYEWVPRRVANADDGDVGIVPIDGRGSEVVATVTEAIGQLHRHAVMFYDDGRYTRHDTMYMSDGEDGSESDAGGDYVRVRQPLIGAVRLDEDDLTNGLPGAISQTIDDTYDRGRLAATGLVLKPELRITLTRTGMTFSEPDRASFEAAVTAARSTAAYYKLSDYTDMDSMSRPWSSTRTGDLRGSHCSGYVTHFFRAEGLSVADVTYPEAIRQDVAEILFDEVRGQCRNQTNAWSDFLAVISGHWSACTNVANQVVNCFADRGCGDLTNGWRNGVGPGVAVSPDNLLPDSFRFHGSTEYDWDGIELTAEVNGAIPLNGRLVNHPGLSGSEPTTSSTSTSPFERVEALRYSGGYAVLVDSIRL